MVTVTEVKRKLCLLGDGGVGKTSLIRRFVLNSFSDDYITTIGTKVVKKRLNLRKDENNIFDLNLIIWDVMGQKEFVRTQSASLFGSHGALVICDVTRKETLESVIHWQNVLYDVADEVPIVVLANKNDLISQAQFTMQDLGVVCQPFNLSYFTTSAKTGENVELAFQEIGKKLV